MNNAIGVALAILVYPGILVALFAAWLLSWVREATVGVARRAPLNNPLRSIDELRASFGEETFTPAGLHPFLLTLASGLAVLCPLLALILLPLPGNPLATAIGLSGDIALEGALLLGTPLARLLVGWATHSPYTRRAADGSARLLAGAALPMILALTTIAQQVSALRLNLGPSQSALPIFALIARVLAIAAFATAIPVLARITPLDDQDADAETLSSELAELSGRDLALFRVGEALQLVAVAAVFLIAVVLPVFAAVSAPVTRYIILVVGMLLVPLGIGLWESLRARSRNTTDRPPLSWWLGIPVLLGLAALVAAAWAARG